MSIEDLHPGYISAINAIKRCRDVYIGQSAIRNKVNNLTPYFPMFAPADQKRYDRVIELSSFTNYTGHTVDKLVGAAFNEDPKTNLEESQTLKYMLEDADGSGGDLKQVATSIVRQNTIAGRVGLLVNYPSTGGETLSKDQVKKLNLRASIHQYEAEAIPNWGIKNGKLHYIVLLESKLEHPDDMFDHDSNTGRRVYSIAEDGLCYQQYVEDGQNFILTNDILVSDFSGKGLDYIPFVFCGSVDNTANTDKPPISDMADVNIAHYQISVEESENLALHGQLTLGVTSDLSASDWVIANPNGLAVGANSGYLLGTAGGFHTATIPESSALPAAKAVKVQELVALGANLIDKTETVKTATEASINVKEQTSTMQNVVNNVSDAIEMCLEWAEQLMTASPAGGFEYRINTEFYDNGVSDAMFANVMQARDRNAISNESLDQVVNKYLEKIITVESTATAAEEDV
jgi:hypothetical protein